jgi:hypothetical protein
VFLRITVYEDNLSVSDCAIGNALRGAVAYDLFDLADSV